MASRWNFKLTKRYLDETVKYSNGKLMKQQVDETAGWCISKQLKWEVDEQQTNKVASWWNSNLIVD